MQDRYAGDIGDFIKLGLLRALSSGRKLGVAWYRFPDEDHNKDGRHVSYLDDRRYQAYDPELMNHLRGVVHSERSINSLMPMLGNTTFHDESLDVKLVPYAERRSWRKNWFVRVQERLAECDLVFADPDNGIVDNSNNRKGSGTFGKQMPLEEVLALSDGRCAIIYHHNTRRKGGHDAEVDHWIREMQRPTIAVRATAYSPRTFFIVNPDNGIEHTVSEFCNRWRELKVRMH